MGFIEETGAAQHYRDARITTIYEGTTGIQANDLIGRKTARDGGAVARAVAAEIDKVAAELSRRTRRRRCNAIGAAARGGDRRAAGGDRLDGARVRPAHARRARGRGALPRAVGTRRPAAGRWARGADRGRAARRRATAMRDSCAPRSPPRASTPIACCRRPTACRKRSRTAAKRCWRWPPSSSDGIRRPARRAGRIDASPPATVRGNLGRWREVVRHRPLRLDHRR